MDGIWSCSELAQFDTLPETRLSLGEGNTTFRFLELAGHQILGIKDENENPNGSFKDRSLAYQISCYLDNGVKNFVISSSGNAAVSASAFCQLAGAKITVFVAETINLKKLDKLQKIASTYDGVVIKQCKQPKSDAIKYAHETGAINLRGSQDDLAIVGFKTIAYELAKQYPQLDAVFVPCSSATSTVALAQAFLDMKMQVAVIACQTTKINAIAKEFVSDFKTSETSLADAISDRVALRKDKAVALLGACNGGAAIIADFELEAAKNLLQQYGFDYSYNSLLGFAGFLQKRHGKFLHPVVIASGL